MNYVWDKRKSLTNQAKHGFGFEIVLDFDWDLALGVDIQIVDSEVRELWIGPIELEIFTVVITERDDQIRIISLRLATNFEKVEWRNEFQ